MLGTALSYGNTDDLVTVKLSNGQTVTAIAANIINSSRVLVLKEGQKYYAWGETPPQEVLRNSSGVQIVPISQEEAAEVKYINGWKAKVDAVRLSNPFYR